MKGKEKDIDWRGSERKEEAEVAKESVIETEIGSVVMRDDVLVREKEGREVEVDLHEEKSEDVVEIELGIQMLKKLKDHAKRIESVIVRGTENASGVALNQENVIVKEKGKEGNDEREKEEIDWNTLKLMMAEKLKLRKNHWMIIQTILNTNHKCMTKIKLNMRKMKRNLNQIIPMAIAGITMTMKKVKLTN